MFPILTWFLLIASAPPAPSVASPPPPQPQQAAPTANLTGLIRADDYPVQAIEAEEEGTVTVAISVDERGAVSDCIVEESSGSPSLDAQTCRLMWLRARFTPARDARGAAVKGVFRQRISWRLEGGMPVSAWASRIVIRFGPDGKLKSCRVSGEGALSTAQEDCGNETSAGEPAESLGLVAANTTVTIEERFFPEMTSAPEALPLDGEKIVSRVVLAIDINEQGKVSGCREVQRQGTVSGGDPCAGRPPSFEPSVDASGQRRAIKAVMMFSVYVRAESVT